MGRSARRAGLPGVLAIVLASGAVPDQARAIRANLAGLAIELELDLEQPFPDFFRRLSDPSQRIPMGTAPVGEGLPEWLGLVPTSVRSREPWIIEPHAARRNRRSTPRMGSTGDLCPQRRRPTGGLRDPLGLGSDRMLGGARPVPHDRGGSPVPYMFVNDVQVVSERVVGYSFDQFGAQPALDRLALAPGFDQSGCGRYYDLDHE